MKIELSKEEVCMIARCMDAEEEEIREFEEEGFQMDIVKAFKSLKRKVESIEI